MMQEGNRYNSSATIAASNSTANATYADVEVAPPHLVAEIVDGCLFTRRHGQMAPAMVRSTLRHMLREATQMRSNPDAPWQIVTLPELHLGNDVLVPEFASWSVARMPFLPDDHVSMAPDWVCEFVADDSLRNPAVSRKLEIYRQLGVRHIWIINLTTRQLCVIDNERHADAVDTVEYEGIVAAPPFDAISFSLADLWPLDKPLGFNEDPQALYAGDR